MTCTCHDMSVQSTAHAKPYANEPCIGLSPRIWPQLQLLEPTQVCSTGPASPYTSPPSTSLYLSTYCPCFIWCCFEPCTSAGLPNGLNPDKALGPTDHATYSILACLCYAFTPPSNALHPSVC